METKRERFVRLAEARTNKIIKMIDLLGNLSNKSSYDYMEDDVKQIYERIQIELNTSRERFGYNMRKTDAFSLTDNTQKNSQNIIDDEKVNKELVSLKE